MPKPKTVNKKDVDWASDLANTISKETFNLLDAAGYPKGPTMNRHVKINFLAKFLGILVSEALHDVPKEIKNAEDRSAFVSGNFTELRDYVQQAVAAGFEAAVADYTNKQADFYCQIKRCPEPTSKYPN